MRRFWWLLACAVLIVAIALTALLWPRGRELPPTRATVYSDFSACLLAGPQGLADPAAAPVWAGMQDASNATKAKVSYLAAAGPETVGNTSAYVTSLLQRQCGVVVTVGQIRADSVLQHASQYPNVRFVLVDGKGSGPNVTTVPAADARTDVAQAIDHAVTK
jgi:basic membrane lipoprotein Med (substrate-binding protein (PBP1-ABC) superfamily)